jgi:uncharacterized protein (DUF952 family)
MTASQRYIYHLVTPDLWLQNASQPYRAASLATEGFIHCSNREQVEWAANRFYSAAPQLLLLGINVSSLSSPVRDEDAGNGERFPHIYGPIQPEAIVTVEEMQRGPNGRWTLSPKPADSSS